ncbi:hypothetical protein KR51_00036030 [Rubidibacter lacunae KORDI 51-2]|uniref:Uncharacterized protein n=1 Tax=Rubidibacter lacunae KORDI 51-2 TaxID=582515 RepID=U5D5F0_9CHRO|nr:hypothetical protein KR51_00036030 [Rubidibacter lacunae KORDI 51-2]
MLKLRGHVNLGLQKAVPLGEHPFQLCSLRSRALFWLCAHELRSMLGFAAKDR